MLAKVTKRVPIKEIRKYIRKTARRIWCPGCGNGITMGAMIQAIIRSQISPEKIAVLSGVGCSGRGSAYVEFDAMHTPHGRTLPCATGIKLVRPDMHVIVFSGDGDMAAIGGNHFIHAARRNIGITVIVVNNYIYGMTGGQVGPTTPLGSMATTAPYGNIETQLDICALASVAGASYVARSTTYHVNQLVSLVEKGIQNKGFSVIEVISQCPTQYGKLNNLGSPAKMLLWMKDHTIDIQSAGNKSAAELEGKIITGEILNRERPEYTEQYAKLRKKAQKEGVET